MSELSQPLVGRHSAQHFSPANATNERLAYRVDPFCKAVGIGRTTLYALIREGKIRTVLVGGRRLIPAAEAHRLVHEGC